MNWNLIKILGIATFVVILVIAIVKVFAIIVKIVTVVIGICIVAIPVAIFYYARKLVLRLKRRK